MLTEIPYKIGFVELIPSITKPKTTTTALIVMDRKAALAVVFFQNKPKTIGINIEPAKIAYATSIATNKD